MPTNPPAVFVADAPGLDFLNSIATPLDVPVDWIVDGRGLIDWLGQAKLVAPDDIAEIAAKATPAELDRVAREARELREWFRGFVRDHAGRPLGAKSLSQLTPLERLLERDETYTQIVARPDEHGHRHLALETKRRWRSADVLLAPLGEAMARVVAEADFSHIKACEGHNCTLMFLDQTRGRARRWCSMGVCGNRAKVSAHRQRQRAN
jgi:predicted RNA-binding Zn ribbon-like protein